MTKLTDIIERLHKDGQDALADEIENSMEYTTFHKNENSNEIRQSREFQMALRNLLSHKKEAENRGECEMSWNFRALADDHDEWLGTKIYNELENWAGEKGLGLRFYEHANIRGDYQLCFTMRW